MPLTLPPGFIAEPYATSPDDLLVSARTTDYRFELLDRAEGLVGELTSVEGGSVTWDAYASVKSSGSIEVTDDSADIDWVNTRVKPWMMLESTTNDEFIEVPLGIYTCAAPVEQWSATGRAWKIELIDKTSILDTDIATDVNGMPISYAVDTGANILTAVKTIIESTGESAAAIEPADNLVAEPLTWPVGTPLLVIINELLSLCNYASLWTDRQGQFRTQKWVDPIARSPVYDVLQPFVSGETSLMDPSWTHDKDIYGIPNRYVVLSPGSGDEEALQSVAVNVDVNSPFSYQNRGRWITSTENGVEAESQEELDIYAVRQLKLVSSVSSKIDLNHAFLPALETNSTIRFVNEAAGLNTICMVLQTEVSFDPLELCKSKIQEVM